MTRRLPRYGAESTTAMRVAVHQYEVPPRPIDEARQALRLCPQLSCSHWSARGSTRCTRCGSAL